MRSIHRSTPEDAALKPHPYAELFPMMGKDDLQAMANDIKTNGLVDPITPYKKLILDGRNRHRACELAGVTPQYSTPFEGTDAEALAFVLSKNLNRRHLDASQRAMVAALLANMPVGRSSSGSNSADLRNCNDLFSQAKAAEMLNVGERTVSEAKKVIEHGTPKLIAAVNSGEVTVNAAAEVAELPEAEQKKLVAEGPAAVKAKASELRHAKKKPETVSQPIPAPVATEPVDTPDVEARKPYKVPAHDKDGIPIQEWAVDAFEDVPEFRDLIRTAKQLRKQLTALADKPGGSFLARRGQWTTTGKTEDGTYSGNWKFDSLENFLMLLEDTMPLHTDCPYAHNSSHEHEGLKCITCRGLNWTPKQLRGIISKEIIASLFNHYGLDANV